MELLLQFVVLAFTALVWWLARRDLTLRAAQTRAGEAAELERLRAGVENLAADLERRAEASEDRLARRIAEARAVVLPLCPNPAALAAPAARTEAGSAGGGDEGLEDRYAPALALAAAGVTDPTEIARRTGLGRGEIELLLNLRARRTESSV